MGKYVISRSDIKQVRAGLMLNSLSYAWLISRLEQKGIMTNKFTVSKIFNGSITSGEKAYQTVMTAKEIIKDYEEKINA